MFTITHLTLPRTSWTFWIFKNILEFKIFFFNNTQKDTNHQTTVSQGWN